jgi:2-oxoglutarate dehydrogenase E2 component (dihydrolipoamide succinyltransferase)
MISIKVPPLGESIVEATIARWLKKEGEAVAAGDTLVELETDKVTVEVPALKGGVLARQVKREGDVVAVDEVLGEIDETAASGAATRAASAPATAAAASGDAPPLAAARAAPPAPAAPAADGQATAPRAAPAARRMAAEEGIDLATVTGTGRGGVVSKPDVIEQRPAAQRPAPAAPQSAAATAPAPSAPPARPAPPPSDGARETRE